VKIKLTEVGSEGEQGARYVFSAELDVADADEAYVKGRQFQKITYSMVRGLHDGADEQAAQREESEEE